MQLQMIKCPKCGNDFPLKRKQLGYHVCISCSTAKPKVAITTVEGTGDHTYNDIIIMEQDDANRIARGAAAAAGSKVHLEMLDYDNDENEVSQSLKEKVHQVLEDQDQYILE